jgi:murein DD-endopeptidase MepM/ murein hydrolase activator NlpD
MYNSFMSLFREVLLSKVNFYSKLNLRRIFASLKFLLIILFFGLYFGSISKSPKKTENASIGGEFVSSISCSSDITKSLLGASFFNGHVDSLKGAINAVFGGPWYDSQAKIKIKYISYCNQRYIQKVRFSGSGKTIHIKFRGSRAVIKDVDSNSRHSVLNGFVQSGSVSNSLRAKDVPNRLRREAIDFIQNAGIELKTGEKFSCVYNPKSNKVVALFTSHPQRSRKSAILYKTSKGFMIFSEDGRVLKGVKEAFRTPCRGKLTSRFGFRIDPFSRGRKVRFHSGVDIGAPTGTPVFPAAEGRVVFVGYNGGYGKCVIVRHGNISTLYGHLHSFASGLKVGSKVKPGRAIAKVGSTGRSTGPHLHFEVWRGNVKVDPLKFKNEVRYILKGSEKKRFLRHSKEMSAYC